MLDIISSKKIADKDKLRAIIEKNGVPLDDFLKKMNENRMKEISRLIAGSHALPEGMAQEITSEDLARFIEQGFVPRQYQMPLLMTMHYKQSMKPSLELVELFTCIEGQTPYAKISYAAPQRSAAYIPTTKERPDEKKPLSKEERLGLVKRLANMPAERPLNGYTGEWMDLLLQTANLTPAAMAEKSGFPVMRISRVMSGDELLDSKQARALCVQLGIMGTRQAMSLFERARADKDFVLKEAKAGRNS